jgi:NAD(P)-dependent dehydrogenase (short-subunit alcohol dehydrogenase family)
MSSLTGRKALVMGGTSGIGLAVARHFVAVGAQVAITGRRDGEKIAEEIGARFLRGDVTREHDVLDALETAIQKAGPLDILVNNAGHPGENLTIEAYTAEDFRKVFAVNVDGVFYGLKHGPRHMNDGGSIINTSSVTATFAAPTYGPYGATKAAVNFLTRTSALELAPRGIRVNAICPGAIDTEMAPDKALIEALTPLGRIGTADELVGLYEYLASDAGRYVSGQLFHIDGGMTAGIGLGMLQKLGG